MKKRKIITLSVIGGFLLVILIAVLIQTGTGGSYTDRDGQYRHLTTAASFNHIYKHPLWEGSGKNLYSPWSDDTVRDLTGFMSVRALCHWCGWDAEAAVDGMNYLIDCANAGKLQIMNIYSDEEIASHPEYAKAQAVFYQGCPDMPVAIVAAGGGYTQVCSMFEGFPYAEELNRAGYNVFVLKYRVGNDIVIGEDVAEAINPMVSEASKDMQALIRLISRSEGDLGIRLDGYSLWGSSAGGGLITAFAFGYEGKDYEALGIPEPAALILVYTHAAYINQFEFSESDPPVYTIVGVGDAYGGDRIMDTVVPKMESAGMTVLYHKFGNYPHGSGLGVGTDAEGWIDEAMAFWEEHRNE